MSKNMICHICKEILVTHPSQEILRIIDSINNIEYTACSNGHANVNYNANAEIISYGILFIKNNKEYIISSNSRESILYEKSIEYKKNMIISKIDTFYPLPIDNDMVQAEILFSNIINLNIFS